MDTIELSKKNGRRSKLRLTNPIPLRLRYKVGGGNYSDIEGVATSLHDDGISCKLLGSVPPTTNYVYLQVTSNGDVVEVAGRVSWIKDSGHECGVTIKNSGLEWKELVAKTLSNAANIALDRRVHQRRRTERRPSDDERRISDRRFSHLIVGLIEEEDSPKIKKFFRNKTATYTSEMINARREWYAELTNTSLKHLAYFSEDPADFKGKIESPIGVAHVPLGIAGPLKINGEHARGIFFVPMATTEGALITSYSWGANIVTRSGGANVKIIKDELKSDPTFVFKNLSQAASFVKWIDINFRRIKEIAEKTSNHLKLVKITPIIVGRRVIVSFHFYTGDAMGMNMAFKATDVACKMMKHAVHPEEFWLHSNFNSIKKAGGNNLLTGYGKTVMADVTIPRKMLEILNTTPEDMERLQYRLLQGASQGMLIGSGAHAANAMAAIAIACGQDAALVANTFGTILGCEVNKSGDLYFSVFLPSVFAATVGGGTDFGTSRECLSALGCYGKGKSRRFAEIIAATVLAGEISLTTAVANGTYVHAHEMFGRNRPHH